MRRRGVWVLAVALLVGLIVLGRASDVVVDWLWFASVGYGDVFWVSYGAKLATFGVVFVASSALLWANFALAHRLERAHGPFLPATIDTRFSTARSLPELLAVPPPALPWRPLIAAAALLLGVLIAIGEAGNHWDTALRYVAQVPYGQTDPVFGHDIGFYLFSLPAYVALKNWAFLILAFAVLGAVVVHWAHGGIRLDRRPVSVSRAALAHGSGLLAVLFAVKACSYALDRYLLLYDDNGVVVGASYTDIHLELPVLWSLIALAGLAALAAAFNIRRRSYRIALGSVVLVFGASFLFGSLVPGLFQRFYVQPTELEREAPYIARNIALTREAFNLRRVEVKPFPAAQRLTFQSLEDNRATVDNIRLWDWQPLMDTYAQLQEIRTYYKFHDIDVDRYDLGGSYQQVMLTARELDSRLLPANAQTWVNLHLLFTHGSGVVMSPVTRISSEGLPLFYLKDIPPVVTGGPPITEPRIYFGQGRDDYVVVKGTVPEFDYPKGKDNAYASYDGADGVAIGGTAMKTLFAWYFNDPNLLLSSYLTEHSRIVFRRNIQERVHAIAPFLQLDHDPYLVISDGRLYWLQDAYTTSSWFPYAQPRPGGITYIRNSVKVAIDAYNGTVVFYAADEADPLLATYRRIFPSLFKPFDAMSADLRKHVRYPEDLFQIQAEVYRAYHMDAPEVFYNREDLWQFPRQPSSLDAPAASLAASRGAPAPTNFAAPDQAGTRMAPYYIVMRLPGEPRAEFFLMLPMVPSQRENMIAWLAARCDAPDYGKLIVYEFPKDKLVYGPFQIEARINQSTEISQQLSLWNQMGSRVIRGNQLVIPIEDSLLYVSPLYLRAESGQLPELKRVIAAYGDRVVMEETLAGALAALFRDGAPAAAAAPGAHPAGAPIGPGDERARAALAEYQRAVERINAALEALRSQLDEHARPPAQ